MDSDINVFEQAAIRKLRFNFRGLISTEDLFDLTAEQLDQLYRGIAANNAGGEGLIKRRKLEADSELALAVVARVFELKRAEADRREAIAAKRTRNQRIMEILREKQDGALRDKSEDELKKLLDE